MYIRKVFLSVLITLMIIISSGTCFVKSQTTNNTYKGQVSTKKKPLMSDNTKRVIKYSAFGAGAGYVLSGKENRKTNMLKGAGIGAAAGILTKPNK